MALTLAFEEPLEMEVLQLKADAPFSEYPRF